MSNIIDSIKLSGVTYTIQGSGGGGNPTIELTQAQYDALVTAGTVQADTYYIITDAQAGDLTNYYTKTETNTLLNGKQATLVSGTNIKTINNESILGSGNIDIQGGSTYTAGRGISIANDTISFSLPIYAGTGYNSIVEGNGSANGRYSHAEGEYTNARANHSHSEGYSTYAEALYSHVEGQYTTANNQSEHASGQFNVSNKASNTFGNSGNTLFSVGNGTNAYGGQHNAFEIRQNGDIYLSLNGQDVKLQDQLGGGNVPESRLNLLHGYGTSGGTDLFSWSTGSTSQVVDEYVAFSKINNTSIFCGKNTSPTNFSLVETSAITTSVTSSSTDAQIPSAKAVYDAIQEGGGGGGEGTVSALTETNPVLLKGNTYYTATTVDTIYLISKFDSTFYSYYTMGAYLSDDGYFEIYTSGNENGITSVSASTAFTSTITDGIAEIKFVSPLTLKQINTLRNRFIAYYFPPTPYTSGSTSEVVEGAVYDSLRKLSLDVLQKDGINDYYIYATDDGIGFNLRTDKDYYSGNLALASPTINFNGRKLNTQFSSTTASQVVINNGDSNYCTLFYSKSYDDITITFNPLYNGGVTQANFTIYAQISEYQSAHGYFTYDIANNSISWSSSDWDTYFTVVDTLSTDHKLKIIANTGYKISEFNSGECLICGVDHPNPNGFVVTLVTTTSNIHDGQEIIDDLYTNKVETSAITTSVTSSSTDAQVPSAKAVNDKLGGLSLVKLSQSEYDNLSTYDSNTLYVIVN